MFFLCLVIFILLFVVVAGVYTFIIACVRRKEYHWLIKEEIEKTSYKDYYKYILIADKWLKDHCVKDVYIRSDDGLKLHGLWIPAENPKGTVLFAHGYRSTYLVDFALAMEFYHNKGMNLLIPDQRCHGQSEGLYITFGVKESGDMHNWIKFHNETLANCPVMLSGLSMGASTMLYLADQDLPDNVRGIIADCGFTSPKDILTSVFKAVIHAPPVFCLWITNICCHVFAGFGLQEKDSRLALQNSKVPVFIVHGKDDNFVPCQMSQQAHDACTGIKEILLVEGADHGVSFVVDRETYIARIEKFLKTCGIN